MKVLELAMWLLGWNGATDIRTIDWRNGTYPLPEDLIGPDSSDRTFTLTDGEIPFERRSNGSLSNMPVILDSVEYGDVTGDGEEDAVLVMIVITGGSAAPGIVYVYRIHEGKPDLLWNFGTGDRADGGLRDVRIENGKLVVELNSPEGSEGDCCPIRFVRTSYRWTSSQFVAERQQTHQIPK